jgi:hypothetical protein
MEWSAGIVQERSAEGNWQVKGCCGKSVGKKIISLNGEENTANTRSPSDNLPTSFDRLSGMELESGQWCLTYPRHGRERNR